ncbi:MAG: twin-arginine translocase subunit TatC [Leptospiraceae bacterium]|nr:twin-arginine translocase subunit TatC [Leptospiraceae bacterium]MCK6380700.1 twin-arginine translocase subunit TatC [Leptospiraceae bacterium]NUM42610.1 twin-arginine translocase subunit TatC [Leptospiraceae bacterium]
MTLGEHLEELRQRIIRILITLGGTTTLALFFASDIHKFFAQPYKNVLGENANFYQIKVMAPLLMYLQTSFMIAILVTFPVLLYLLWGFIAPAVDEKTEKSGKLLILFSTVLFWAGLALCYFTVFESMLKVFLVALRPPDIETKLPIDEYYDLFFNVHLIFGLAFQLPVVLILLGRIGILSSNFLIKRWREAVVIISIFSAVLSPGPDVFSMMMLFVPLTFLFGFSLVIMKILEKRDT